MNDPQPALLPDSPLEFIDARTLFASGTRVRRHFGGLHTLPSGRLLLTFMFGTMPRTNDGGTMIASSDDHGVTWSEPMPLYAVPGWDSFPNGGVRRVAGDRIRLFVGQYRFAPASAANNRSIRVGTRATSTARTAARTGPSRAMT